MRYLLPFCLLLAFCQTENQGRHLVVRVEKLALRSAPGINSAEMTLLRQGEKLLDLGEVSRFESHISFDGIALQSPWLKVETTEGKAGWVFAGAVLPQADPTGWLLQKRLLCYFGSSVTGRLHSWKNSANELQTDGQLAAYFREALALRDTMLHLLEYRAEPSGRPDFTWLADGVLPGFIYQQASGGAAPFLYADYRYWHQIARQTTGPADEAFFETCFAAFPLDSIESLFPVWKFQLSETESASQLGSGRHLKMLQLLDQTLTQSPLFELELMRFKDALLDDIQDKSTQFWQEKALILKELDAIMTQAPACVRPQERQALAPRRTMLEAAESNGIRVGLRAGTAHG